MSTFFEACVVTAARTLVVFKQMAALCLFINALTDIFESIRDRHFCRYEL